MHASRSRARCTTTSSAPAPTRATARRSRRSGGVRAPTATCTATATTGWYCAGCEEFVDAEPTAVAARSTTRRSSGSRRRTGSSGSRATATDRRPISSRRDGCGSSPTRGATRCSAFLAGPVRDISVSRPARPGRATGASRYPAIPTQVVYVWFDALANYISALGVRRATTPYARVVGHRRRARARDRQGHRAVPRGDLARDPAVGRAAAPDARCSCTTT